MFVRNATVIGLLRWLYHVCAAESTLMGCSYDTYRKLLRAAQEQSGLTAGYTPHSPRAGFATESIAEGADFVSVREAGRWLSDTSLRVYLDVVGAASLAASQKAAGREHELVFAAKNFLAFFPGAENYQRQEDHDAASTADALASKNDAKTRWSVAPSMGPGEWTLPSGLSATSPKGQQGIDSNSESDEPGVTFVEAPAGARKPGSISCHGERVPRGRGRGQKSSSRGQGGGRSFPSQAAR